MKNNLPVVLHNREISDKRNHRPNIEALLESSYFKNSDEKHLAEDLPLNTSGVNLNA